MDEEYTALRQHVENLLQNTVVSEETKAKIYKHLQQSKIKTAPMAWAFGGTFAQQIIGKGGSGIMIGLHIVYYQLNTERLNTHTCLNVYISQGGVLIGRKGQRIFRPLVWRFEEETLLKPHWQNTSRESYWKETMHIIARAAKKRCRQQKRIVMGLSAL